MDKTIGALKNILNSASPNLAHFNTVLIKANPNVLFNASNKDAAEILRGVVSLNVSNSTLVKSLEVLFHSPLSSRISNADVGEALIISARQANFDVLNAIIDNTNINQLGNVTNSAASEVLRTVANGENYGYSEAKIVSTINNIFSSPLSSRISNADVGEALIISARQANFDVLNAIIDNTNINQLGNVTNSAASEVLRTVANGENYGYSEAKIVSTINNIFSSPLSSRISNADVGEALIISARQANFDVLNAIIDNTNINQLGNVTNSAASEVLRTVANGENYGYSEAKIVSTINNIFSSPLSSRISNADVGEALIISARQANFDVLNAIIDNANINQLGNVTNSAASEVLRTAANGQEYGVSMQKMLHTIDNILSSPLASSISDLDLKENNITYGSNSAETHQGSGADDIVFGNGGNDTIFGNNGNDYIVGGEGADRIFGGAGNDVIYTWKVNDFNRGLTSGDFARGDDGNDTIYAGTGHDKLFGDAGHDKLYSCDGNDELYGGAGNDQLFAGSGNDNLFGGSGNDRLIGEVGDDVLRGDAGRDILDGGSGKNVLYGGTELDSFVFDTQALDGSTDIIKDYQLGERLDITKIIDMLDPSLDVSSLAILDYIKVTTVNGHKTLSFDVDGEGGRAAIDIVTVENARQIDVLVDQTLTSQVVHIFV